MKKQGTLFFLLLLALGAWNLGLGTLTSAQTPIIDSLRTALTTASHDTTRINTLNALGWELMYSNPDTAIILGNQALVIVRKHGERSNLTDREIASLTLAMTKAEANTLGNLGAYNYLKSDYPKALDYYLKALKIDEELNNKTGIAKRLGNIGIVYRNQADYPKALNYYLKALKIAEELGNKQLQANNLGNIGIVYYEQADYPKALDYSLKALKIAEELGNKNHIAAWLGNIGNVYKDQADYPKALDYYLRALKIDEELGNKNGIAIWLGNIGIVYSDQADYPKALDYYLKALKMAEELEYKQLQANSLGNIGSLYTKTGKFKEAEEYLKKAIAIDSAIGSQDYLRQTEELLSHLYDNTGEAAVGSGSWQLATERFKLSMLHYKKAMVLKDTIFSEENKKQLIRKEMTYQFEKKELAAKAEQEKKDAVSAEEKKKEKVIRYSVLAGLVLMFIVALVIFRSLRITRKQKHIIEMQKDEVTTQRDLVEKQKEEIAGKNKDLTDSIRYAALIQGAVLPPVEEIKKALPESFILFKPKDIVSGDFYFFAKVIEKEVFGNRYSVIGNKPNTEYRLPNTIIIAACDCTGHGVPGAFMSMIGSQLLNEIVNDKSVTDAAEVLNQLRDGIIHAFGEAGATGAQKDGMDMALCTISPSPALPEGKGEPTLKYTLQYAGANNPLYILRNGKTSEVLKTSDVCELEVIKPDKQPIGYHFVKQTPFTNHDIQLEKGDTIYMTSDGYQDQFGGPRGKKFMNKQLREVFSSLNGMTMEEQKEHLDKTIEGWKGSLTQVDDILVIGVRM